jgi:hypothetical protein
LLAEGLTLKEIGDSPGTPQRVGNQHLREGEHGAALGGFEALSDMNF